MEVLSSLVESAFPLFKARLTLKGLLHTAVLCPLAVAFVRNRARDFLVQVDDDDPWSRIFVHFERFVCFMVLLFRSVCVHDLDRKPFAVFKTNEHIRLEGLGELSVGKNT